jgi:hypothetical protein
MSAAFTPGPWEFRTLKNGWALFPSAAPKNWSLENVICGGEGDYDHLWDKEPDEADASLIAAAPELYGALDDVLIHVLADIEAEERKDEPNEAALAIYRARRDKATAALAKARGEQ